MKFHDELRVSNDMAIDQRRIRFFIEKSGNRTMIAEAVRHAGFTITWVVEERPELWGFYLKPNRTIRSLIGVSREIILWVSEYREFQARAVSQALSYIDYESPRLSEEFGVICTPDEGTQRAVEEIGHATDTFFVGYSIRDWKNFEPIGDHRLLSSLRERFFAHDLYYLSTAIVNRNAFFGRSGQLKEVESTIKGGTAHIAVFGLRKMGKTSFLFRVADDLRASKSIAIAHIDLQRLDSISPTVENFLWSVGEQVYASHSSFRRIQGFRLFGKYSMLADVVDTAAIVELFDHDIRLLLKKSRRRIVLMFDEIELMSPETPGSEWNGAYVRCWRLLRGLDQSNPGRLRYVVAGTNPSCIEKNRLSGRENPTYNYFTKTYLGPLAFGEADKLVTVLGRRMGLEWTESAIKRLYRIVGGHPFLLRSFASRIHRSLSPRNVVKRAEVCNIDKAVPGYLRDMNSTLSQMVEVLQDHYSNEYYMLELLSAGRVGEFRELAIAFPDDVAHLVGYGLVNDERSSTGLAVELLQTWLQNRARARVSRSAPNAMMLLPGSEVDGFEIQAVIGHSGGFGQVFEARAQSLQDKRVALKVLKSGSLSALQREVDVLREVSHENIVSVLDHGKLETGQLYIAMEFVDGPTFRSYCTRATRLNAVRAISAMGKLLEALVGLHPNQTRLKELQAKSELSSREFRQLEAARLGYVHRDIKPENIIDCANKGPVLIDFGIAVRVSDPVKTMSATPGYLPPDGVLGKWTPDVDLYQLGLTMMQVATGIPFDGSNAEDLREVVEGEVGGVLGRVLMRMTEAIAADRYASAGEALKELKRG